jgi:AraC-like DNA-binding protein
MRHRPVRQAQRRPDGSVWVRTHPLTMLHDHTLATHSHEWDQLTYATAGVLRVSTGSASWIVPPHRAVWVPAGVAHAEQMFAPVSVRTLYFAPRIARTLPRACCTLNISGLLRELILHVSRIGALDRQTPWQARLIGVLLDQMTEVSEVPLQLPLPHDARALRFASILQAAPGETTTVATLARKSGASLRTIERLFVRETGMAVAEWRRRLRLLHAVRLLAEGEPVTNVSLEIGYSSVSAFIAVFKKSFGATPSQFRVQNSDVRFSASPLSRRRSSTSNTSQ